MRIKDRYGKGKNLRPSAKRRKKYLIDNLHRHNLIRRLLKKENEEELKRVIELSKIQCGPPSTYVTEFHTVDEGEAPWEDENVRNLQNLYKENTTEERVICNEATFENAVINLEQMIDEDYNFSQFLYYEMKTFSSMTVKRKLHLTIQKALLDASREDEHEKLEKIGV